MSHDQNSTPNDSKIGRPTTVNIQYTVIGIALNVGNFGHLRTEKGDENNFHYKGLAILMKTKIIPY